MNREFNILVRHGFMPVPHGNCEDKSLERLSAVATVGANLAYYGYALNGAGANALRSCSLEQLENWWPEIEAVLKDITGESRKMGDFVVYKNFPGEVLEMDEMKYWIYQICMYAGIPADVFAEEVKPRENMDKMPEPKILQLANPLSLSGVLNNYLVSTSRWKNEELQDVIFLSEDRAIDFSRIAFKENLVNLCKFFIEKGKVANVNNATDVLRLAAGLSNGDVSLREKVRFRRFKRSERRFLLSMLENCKNLNEDFARRKEIWKRFLFALHVGDYAKMFPNVVAEMHSLYNDEVSTFNGKVEELLADKNESVLELLQTRPGDFVRRLVHTTDLFGFKAAKAFNSEKVLKKLTNAQLVSIRRHLETVNQHNFRVIPPRGNWNKLKIGEARHVKPKISASIANAIGQELKLRMSKIGPKVLDDATSMIKLPTNDGEVSPYARGTVFPIPENINFIRTASYWQAKGHGNVWFDNGWNFFDSNWKSKGTICWDSSPSGFGNPKAAAFSGDPCSSKTKDNKACQVIDLYLDKLESMGITYAVWNILAFSHIPFSKVEDVYASLQWGENAFKGKIFEPAHAQLSFPLQGKQLTKFVCYIDIPARKMVFMDANFKGQVNSASSNQKNLEEQMPAFVEYLDSLPSVHDLFRDSVKKNGNGYVLYSDKDVDIDENDRAYVFNPVNEQNKYHKVELNDILGMKRVDTQPRV